MPTYAELQSRVNVKVVYYAIIRGLPYIFTDGNITSANIGTLFTDAFIPTLTVIPALLQPNITHGRSIELLSGRGHSSGIDIKFLDIEALGHDNFFTWLFGGDDESMPTARLADDVTMTDSTIALDSFTDDNGNEWPSSGYAYCELETFQYTGLSEPYLTGVTRAEYFSDTAAHLKSKDYGIYPVISYGKPVKWEGRIVTLYQTFMDENGCLASDAAAVNYDLTKEPKTCFKQSYPMRGILKDLSYDGSAQSWNLSCVGIENILKRQTFKEVPELSLEPGTFEIPSNRHWDLVVQEKENNGEWFFTSEWHTAGYVEAMMITLYDASSAEDVHYHYIVEIPPAVYTAELFVSAVAKSLLNNVSRDINGLRPDFPGSLTVKIAGNDRTKGLIITYKQPEAGEGTVYSCKLSFAADDMNQWGVNKYSYEYWNSAGFDVPKEASGTYVYDLGLVVGLALFYGHSNQIYVPYSSEKLSLKLPVDTNVNVYAASTASWTVNDFDPGEYVIIKSDLGKTVCKIISKDIYNNLLTLSTVNFPLRNLGVVYEHIFPATVKKCIYMTDGFIKHNGVARDHWFAHPVLAILLSSGNALMNHIHYDVLPAGQGIALSHQLSTDGRAPIDSLIDVISFEEFFDSIKSYVTNIVDIIEEPIDVYEWITKRLAFFGGFLTVKRGRISVDRGYFNLRAEGYEVPVFPVSTTGIVGNHSVNTGGFRAIDSIKWSFNFNRSADSYSDRVITTFGNPTTDNREVNVLEFEDKGIYTNSELLSQCATSITSEFEKELWSYNIKTNRLHFDKEAGDILSYTDDGNMPNPLGHRGHDNTLLLLTGIEVNHDDQTANMTLLQSRAKRGGYGPNAFILSYVHNTGSNETEIVTIGRFSQPDYFGTGNPNGILSDVFNHYDNNEVEEIYSGSITSTTVKDFYDPTKLIQRQVNDAPQFAVTDVVRVDKLNVPSNIPGVEFNFSVTSVSGNTITVTPQIPSSLLTGQAILSHDNLANQTVGSIAKVGKFCALGATGSLLIAGIAGQKRFNF